MDPGPDTSDESKPWGASRPGQPVLFPLNRVAGDVHEYLEFLGAKRPDYLAPKTFIREALTLTRPCGLSKGCPYAGRCHRAPVSEVAAEEGTAKPIHADQCGPFGHGINLRFSFEKRLAVVSIHGRLGSLCGGVSYQALAAAVAEAVDSFTAKRVVLDITSSGGAFEGHTLMRRLIEDAKQIKPIVAYVSGQMTSAAYAIGSAATRVIVHREAWVGGLGVGFVLCNAGKPIVICSARKKHQSIAAKGGVSVRAIPVDEGGVEKIISQIKKDHAETVQSVTNNRALNAKQALMLSDGNVFQGQLAVSSGLADDIVETGDEVLSMAAAMA